MAIPAIAPGARDDDLDSVTEPVTPCVGEDVAEVITPAVVPVLDALGAEVVDGATDELITSSA